MCTDAFFRDIWRSQPYVIHYYKKTCSLVLPEAYKLIILKTICSSLDVVMPAKKIWTSFLTAPLWSHTGHLNSARLQLGAAGQGQHQGIQPPTGKYRRLRSWSKVLGKRTEIKVHLTPWHRQKLSIELLTWHLSLHYFQWLNYSENSTGSHCAASSGGYREDGFRDLCSSFFGWGRSKTSVWEASEHQSIGVPPECSIPSLRPVLQRSRAARNEIKHSRSKKIKCKQPFKKGKISLIAILKCFGCGFFFFFSLLIREKSFL